MAVVLLAAFLMIACLLALRFEKQLTAVLPLATCILILILYVLAFFRRLSWIDYFSTAIVVGAVLRVLFLSGEKKKKLFAQLRELFFAPSAIAAMVLLTGAVLLTGNKIATWWDDLNFWATDVKALYALDGFAAKYTNAASEFGDYPPGIQLLKWWFVHLKPDGFSEGLMFAGYYFGVFVFLTPLLSRLDEALQTDRRTVKQLFWTVVLVVCLAAFPSMTETFYLGGMCADLVMAVIYGVILMSCLEDRAAPGADTAAADTATADIADAASCSRAFSNLRTALYLGVLVLVKSVGFLWAAFALVFVWFWRLHGAADKKKEIRQLLCITALPAVSGGSWMLFCLLMKRVAKLTGAAVSMASGNLPILLEGTVPEAVACVCRSICSTGAASGWIFLDRCIGACPVCDFSDRNRMAVPREASDQNGAEFPVCVCAADGNCFLRHQPCESSDDFCNGNPVSGSNRDDCVDRTLQCTVYSWNVVSAVRDFSGTQSEAVGKNFALCSAGCSGIVVCKLGRCL